MSDFHKHCIPFEKVSHVHSWNSLEAAFLFFLKLKRSTQAPICSLLLSSGVAMEGRSSPNSLSEGKLSSTVVKEFVPVAFGWGGQLKSEETLSEANGTLDQSQPDRKQVRPSLRTLPQEPADNSGRYHTDWAVHRRPCWIHRGRKF